MITSFNDVYAELKEKGICKKLVVAWGVDEHSIEAAYKAVEKGFVTATLVGDAKLIADRIWRFSQVPQGLWVNFSSMDEYRENAQDLNRILLEGQTAADMADCVPAEKIVVHVQDPKCMKVLSFTNTMYLPETMIHSLEKRFGKENVIVTPGKIRG